MRLTDKQKKKILKDALVAIYHELSGIDDDEFTTAEGNIMRRLIQAFKDADCAVPVLIQHKQY